MDGKSWRSFVDGVVDVARAHPDRVALSDATTSWTYHQLLEGSREVAGHLHGLGVAPGDRVGCELRRSADSVVVLLGVLLAGAAWVPLDPKQPAARRRTVVERAGCAAVVVDATANPATAVGDDEGPGYRAPTTSLERALSGPVLAVPVRHESEHLAYVLFTSGSTGEPKGVEVSHGSVTSMLDWARGALTDEDVSHVAGCVSFTFDPSVVEVFATLLRVGTLHVLTDALDPSLAESGATAVQLTPSALRELVRARRLPQSLRTVLIGGEVLAPSVAREFFAVHPCARILHCYGPTETTVLVTVQELRPGFSAITLGRELPGVRIVLLDDDLSAVPDGEVGELCVLGDQLARGYAGDEQLTDRRFVPWISASGRTQRAYRTGDRGRRLPSGELEFLGRLDRQVKVRGFRVELGEVESALRRVPGVQDAVVALDGDSTGARLVAWATAAAGESVDHDALDRVRAVLPAYMVPSVLTVLDDMPLTGAGKIDIAALTAPRSTTPLAPLAPLAPVGSVLATQVAQAVSDVLELPSLPGPRDLVISDLGATSLQLLEVVTRLERSRGLRLDLGPALADASIADLAAAVLAAASRTGQDIASGRPLADAGRLRRSFHLFRRAARGTAAAR